VLVDLDFPFTEFCEVELPLYGVLGSSGCKLLLKIFTDKHDAIPRS
jgi:hypothetical protein